MATEIHQEVVQSCSVLAPATGMWGERTTLYQTEVILSKSDLSFAFDGHDAWMGRRILLEDLIGIRVCAENDGTAVSCVVEMHSLPLVSAGSWFSGRETVSRKQKIDQILFNTEKTFQKNVKSANNWKRVVMQYCENAVKNAFLHADEGIYMRL